MNTNKYLKTSSLFSSLIISDYLSRSTSDITLVSHGGGKIKSNRLINSCFMELVSAF